MTPNAQRASIRSAYRLVRRAASASVMHQSGAAKALRRTYRPVFEHATRMVETNASDAWFQEFNSRSSYRLKEIHRRRQMLNITFLTVDHTVVFLLASATRKGIAHQVTDNAAFLERSRQSASNKVPYPRIEWDPTKPNEAVRLHEAAAKPSRQKSARRALIESNIETALKNARSMAEGQAGTILGRASR